MEVGPPADTPEYAYPAWASCLEWAIGKPEIVKAFEEDTGIRSPRPRNNLDRMIDEATGYDPEQAYQRFAEEFVKWFNVAIWGDFN
jgi:hypothetical protein